MLIVTVADLSGRIVEHRTVDTHSPLTALTEAARMLTGDIAEVAQDMARTGSNPFVNPDSKTAREIAMAAWVSPVPCQVFPMPTADDEDGQPA